MSTTIKTGWLKDNNGDKFAPKTLSSQVVTSDGATLESKIQADLDSLAANKAEKVHVHEIADVNGLQSTLDANLGSAKEYAESIGNTVKNDLLNGAGEAYDTLKELGELIDVNKDALEALETVATGKADKEHTHPVSEISDLTVTATELNYVSGATSNIQEQIDKNAGLKTEGTVYTINGVSVTAGDGAEIFNDYTNNIASGNYSHAEGAYTKATGYSSHAEGRGNEATGMYSHAEGYSNEATGNSAHAEGYDTIASADYSHSEGAYTKATGYSSHAEGNTTEASASYTHAEGSYTKATSSNAHAEGNSTEASGDYSHAEGYSTKASQSSAHAEGYSTEATGQYSHAEGYDSVASGYQSHAEGYSTKATNTSAHAEGHYTEANGSYSHAEGYYSKALKNTSHAEGYYSEANGEYSHAEGERTVTTGLGSHTEGKETKASGEYSHAEGAYTKAAGQYQHVQGRYNIEDTTNTYAHIVGNGQWSSDDSKRSNAHTLDWDGNAWFAGDVYVGGESQDDGKKLVSSLSDLGVAATAAELNYCDGVTSNIQTQIDNIKYDIDDLQAITESHEDAITDIINTYASHTWVTSQIQASIQSTWEASY